MQPLRRPRIGEQPFAASNTGKLLYNPRALPIRFAWDPSVGLKTLRLAL